MSTHYPWFVRKDLDGFFGLFIDNLVQLLLIVFLAGAWGGDTPRGQQLLYHVVLPGAAVSIIFGNILYSVQAHWLAKKTGRSDITALPYGINTPSLLLYIEFVMRPAYERTQDPVYAWKMGLIACVGSGLIEFFGSFFAESIRKRTPRAALLSTLAGIAIGFIAMKFALEIFHRPLVAMVPFGIVLITYFSRTPFPWNLPGGFVAILIGTAIAWGWTALSSLVALPTELAGTAMSTSLVASAASEIQLVVPQFALGQFWELLSESQHWVGYLAIIIPMGLFNVIGSLQNIESSEAAGDSFDTRTSLAINGIGSLLAACFGSCFPTTIYIGHPGWKALGARAGYSTLNGIVISLLCFTGSIALINSLIPMEAGIGIVLWIGIVITAQAFSATEKSHAPAVALGLFPAIAAWGQSVMQGTFIAAGGKTIEDLLLQPIAFVNGFLVQGLVSIERGYIITCMGLSAICASIVDRKFRVTCAWCLILSACAFLGITHSFQVEGNRIDNLYFWSAPAEGWLGFRTTGIAIGYLLFGLICLAFDAYVRRYPNLQDVSHE